MQEELLMIPGPVPVIPRIREAMSRPMISHRSDEFSAIYGEIVDDLKRLFQTKNDLFVLSGSGTCAMEAAVGNLTGITSANINGTEKTKPQSSVVTIVNGKFSERFQEIAVRYAGRDAVTPVRFNWGDPIELEEVKKALEKSSDPEVKANANANANATRKIVTMVHNETSTGMLNPAREVGKLARKHDAVFVLDCITSIGGDDVRVDEFGADIAIVGSQKCIGMPPGLAALSISERAWDLIAENRNRPYYQDLLAYKKSFGKGEGQRQTPYTPALPLFFALHEALKVIKEEGMAKRIERHRRLSNAVRTAISRLGLYLFPTLNEATDYSNTVTAIKTPLAAGITDELLRGGMRKKGVIISGGQEELKGKIFRIATMGNITETEVLRTIAALEEVLAENNFIERVGNGLEAAEEVLL
ncbi:MAG: alanine--glyoxylate aminotransferase family protein [Methanophagales archaeon]|nr:alanine--glyoxylate aminotransferase family protein [Methanophagales archaeon]